MKKKWITVLALMMLAGCAKNNQEVVISDVFGQVKQDMTCLSEVAMMDLTQEDIMTILALDEEMVDEAVGQSAMISVNIDLFVAIHAADGHAGDIKAQLETYQKEMVENSMQYPMNMAVLANAKILQKGDEVYYIRFAPHTEEYFNMDESAQAEAVTEVNEQAVKIIEGFYE